MSTGAGDRLSEDLQVRIAHQDAAIDELTRQSLLQQRQINELIGHVEKLQKQFKDLAEAGGQGDIIDAPPPHY
jgi:uncharacterized coiled-coil protein SlyX